MIVFQPSSSTNVQYDSSSKKFEISKKEITSKIQEELIYVARRNTKSVLAKRDFDALSNVNFKEIIEEMKRLCPTVYDVVFCMLEMDIGTENKIPTMALVYSLTMFKRFREMSLLQRLNTLLLIDGDANQEVIKYNSCQRSNVLIALVLHVLLNACGCTNYICLLIQLIMYIHRDIDSYIAMKFIDNRLVPIIMITCLLNTSILVLLFYLVQNFIVYCSRAEQKRVTT